MRDPIAQHWIANIIQKKKDLVSIRITNKVTRDVRLKDKTLTRDDRVGVKQAVTEEIQDEIREWIFKQPDHTYSLLAPDSGEFINIVIIQILF